MMRMNKKKKVMIKRRRMSWNVYDEDGLVDTM